MEQPPTPPNPYEPGQRQSEPDLPKPPIWERTAPAAATQPTAPVPPIQIPRAGSNPQPSPPPAPAPGSVPRVRAPIVPDITAPTPLATPGPSFAERSFLTTPASGAGVTDKPQWPTAPPMVGSLASPTAAPAPKPKRRVGLAALAIFLAAAVAAGGFFFGRSFASSETSATPIAAAPEVPTAVVEPTTPPATQAPVPTPAPALPPVNDAPSPVLPGEGADEPVAAVAAAVGPAVVLVQNDLGQGSGIIYDDSGLILTNAHVVGQFTEVTITLASGVAVPGQVLGADPLTDVAVIQIDTDSPFGTAVLAPDASVEVGQLAVAIGSPFGLEQTVTSGIVSATGRVLFNPTDDGRESIVAMIQTDAPINPGNSGGALADRQGRVIGMNTSIRTDGSGGNIGVGFAIPSDTAKLIADRIISGEPLEQGFLGVNGDTPLIGEPGVVIGDVFDGGGAQAAGLVTGDRITSFNGIVIKSMSDLAAAVRLQPPNATVPVEFVRDGEPLLLEVTLGVLDQ